MTEVTPAEAQENEATEEYGTATLCGCDLRVKPVNRWRPSYLRALRLADYDTWAAGVLHEDDVETFVDLDATLDEINVFTADAMESAGEAPGKSSGRAKSSKSTRKR
ncbi:hypothetical protein [Streptomyces fulvorobeus]|uniref:Uncharacterized protein n=1 Tax=Streptomyces fulvorobeus TaxID=284028 RepID=A0A7J0CFM5_9ACTN|nr:hypothetical protein [Streptomyces fulvorobeus]NYE44201.1 hypothetical protein [Streptomyces fulvorobeus]GFN00714.1 hypothetical protein Sfulv_55240 [Streptomyces fulvorobeus]